MAEIKLAQYWNTPDIRKLIFHVAVVVDMALLFMITTIPSVWNLHGTWIPAWPLPVDLALFGLMYYWLFRPHLQEFLTKMALLAIFGMLFGYIVLPNVHEALTQILDQHKIVIAVSYAAFELIVLYLLVQKVRTMLRASGDVEASLRTSFLEKFGEGWIGRFAYFEARIWYYGLFMRKGTKPEFEGKEHFSYANNDGNVHHQFCLLMLLIFDMPISHFIMHFVVSAKMALLITALGAWNLLYFVAQYRGSHVRPVSLDERILYIRYGVFCRDRKVPLCMIARAIPMLDSDARQPGELRYRQFGSLNVVIEMQPGAKLANFFGVASSVSRIAMSIDDPVRFIQSVNRATSVTDFG